MGPIHLNRKSVVNYNKVSFPLWISNPQCGGKKKVTYHFFDVESAQILCQVAEMPISPIEMGLIYILMSTSKICMETCKF